MITTNPSISMVVENKDEMMIVYGAKAIKYIKLSNGESTNKKY